MDKNNQVSKNGLSIPEENFEWKLYEAYNELHSLAQEFFTPFDAPVVLVVGHQTKGKSALVEALMCFLIVILLYAALFSDSNRIHEVDGNRLIDVLFERFQIVVLDGGESAWKSNVDLVVERKCVFEELPVESLEKHEMVFKLMGSALVMFYEENDCLDIDRNLFDKLPERDIVLWNVMLKGYLRSD